MNYQKAKETALERDGYRCLICGAEKDLDPHHLIARSQATGLVAEPKNLATLCRVCHDRVEARQDGYAFWKLSAGSSLGAFWKRYATGNVFTVGDIVVVDHEQNLENRALAAPIQTENVSEALAAQKALQDALAAGQRAFLQVARACKKLLDTGYWRVNHETLDDFLRDPSIGFERSRFFKLAKLGRFLEAFELTTGAAWDSPVANLPLLNERIWTRDIIKGDRVEIQKDGKLTQKSLSVIDLAHRAAQIPYHEFEMEVEALDQKAKRPEVPVLFTADMSVGIGKDQVGHVRRVWANDTHQFVLLKLETQKVEGPFRIDGHLTLRIQ